MRKYILPFLILAFVFVATGAVIDNLKISGNTISSLDTDGDIWLSPNGSGEVDVNAPLNVTGITTSIATGVTGVLTVTGSADVDNINIDGNVISSTDTDGDIWLSPNGVGEVDINAITNITGITTITGDTGVTGDTVLTGTLKTTGTVGLGIAPGTPALNVKNSVSSNDGGVYITSADESDVWRISLFDNGYLRFIKSNKTHYSLTLDSAGNMGAGVASPSATLDVGRSADQVQLEVASHSTQTNNLMQFKNSSFAVVASVKESGAADYTQLDVTAAGEVRFQDTTGGEYMGFKAPGTVTASKTFTLPDGDGSSGETMITNGSGVLSWSAVGGGSSSLDVEAISSTDSTDADNNVVSLSGASFTLTLHTAVGNTGQALDLLHSGTSLTQVYTLATTSGQTIGGIASGAYALYTAGESLKLVSDGANWLILSHVAQTEWVDAGAITIDGVTTAPTKSSTATDDNFYWRRNARNAELRMLYRQTGNSGGAAGSGSYIFSLPTGLVAEETLPDINLSTGSATFRPANGYLGGSVGGSSSTTAISAAVVFYTNTTFRLLYHNGGSFDYIDNGNISLAYSGGAFYEVNMSIPIEGWQP